MARIAGVDLPPKKRAEIGLTYIYGIGRTRSKSLLYRGRIDFDKKIRDLTRRRSQPHPPDSRRRRRGRRRPAQRNLDEHQAAHRDGLLPRTAASPQPAGARASARTPTPAPARVRAAARWRTRRKRRVRHSRERSWRKHQQKPGKKKSFKKKEKRVVHVGVVHVQATFNNTIVTITDQEGNTMSWSSAGFAGLPRVAQGHSVRRAAGGA